jgi:hypothetical protein
MEGESRVRPLLAQIIFGEGQYEQQVYADPTITLEP